VAVLGGRERVASSRTAENVSTGTMDEDPKARRALSALSAYDPHDISRMNLVSPASAFLRSAIFSNPTPLVCLFVCLFD